ncbi:MAG: hypothetical protein WD876_01695 [Candidatus Pacearchaeota archaeon]
MLSLSLSQSLERKKYGLVGGIVTNMYSFLESGRNPELVIKDDVNGREIFAKDYFIEFENAVLVRRENLPLDVYVKGAYIRKKTDVPAIEFGEVDFQGLGRQLEGDTNFEVKGKSILSRQTGKRIVETYTSKPPFTKKFGMGKRTLVSLLPKIGERSEITLATNVVDMIYEGNLFKLNSDGEKMVEKISTSGSIKPELRQIYELKQIIEQEQKPSLIQFMGKNMYQEMRATLLQTPNTELDFEKIFTELLRKKVIRKVMVANPSLGWKEATQIVDKLAKGT